MLSIKNADETPLTLHLKETPGDLKTIKELIEKGADINQANATGETPLKLALDKTTHRRNQLKAYLNESDARNASMISSLRKNIALYDLSMDIIQLGANPKNIFTEEGLTFLGDKLTYLDLDSSELQHPKKLQNFLKKHHLKELYAPDLNGNTPLHLLLTPKKEMALLFLSDLILEHTDINEKNNQGDTPLLYGIKQNIEDTLLISLIEKGADIHQKNQEGNTALHLAVQMKERDQLILSLLQKGANINKKNNKGETPLMLATSPLVKRFLYCLQSITPAKRNTLLQASLPQNACLIAKRGIHFSNKSNRQKA